MSFDLPKLDDIGWHRKPISREWLARTWCVLIALYVGVIIELVYSRFSLQLSFLTLAG